MVSCFRVEDDRIAEMLVTSDQYNPNTALQSAWVSVETSVSSLSLVESEALPSGVIIANYKRADELVTGSLK